MGWRRDPNAPTGHLTEPVIRATHLHIDADDHASLLRGAQALASYLEAVIHTQSHDPDGH